MAGLKEYLLLDLAAIDGGNPDPALEAAALNTPTELVQMQERRIGYLTILREADVTNSGDPVVRYGEAKGIVDILRTTTDADVTLVRPYLEAVSPDHGLDICHQSTQLLLQSKVPDVLSQAQVDALLLLGNETVSKAQKAGLPKIKAGYVLYARAYQALEDLLAAESLTAAEVAAVKDKKTHIMDVAPGVNPGAWTTSQWLTHFEELLA